MNAFTCMSVSTAISNLLEAVCQKKQESIVNEVSILAPNISLCQSINRELLKLKKPMLNVFVETPEQHILRKVETQIVEKGGLLSRQETAAILREILRHNKLEYFTLVDEYSSYAWIFADGINNLRMNISSKELPQALQKLGEKGQDFAKILDLYLNAKGVRPDYADALALYSRDDNDSIIAFPGTLELLSTFESAGLDPIQEIDFGTPTQPDIEVKLQKPLSMTHEIREVLRRIITEKLPLDQTAIILPDDYLSSFLAEAEELKLPVKTNMGQAQVLKEGLFLVSILDVLISDYGYEELKEHLYNRWKYGLIRTLSACKIAGGREALEKALIHHKATEDYEFAEENCDNLLALLKKLKPLESLTNNPAELTQKILETFEFGGNSQAIAVVSKICEDLSQTESHLDLGLWRLLLRRRLEEVRLPVASPGRETGSLLLTAEQLPGTFEHVFCLGLTERQFPRTFKEGPLLLDNELQQLNSDTGAKLQTAEIKNRREAGKLEMLIGGATTSWTGTYPAIDLLSGKEENPSPYLNKLQLTPEMPSRLPEHVDECLSESEWLLQQLENNPGDFIEYWVNQDSGATKHLALEKVLWDKNSPSLLGDISSVKPKFYKNSFSASQINRLLTCPFRWLIEKVYKVQTLESPESTHGLSAATMGSLIHTVLEKYVKEVQDGKSTKAPQARLLELLDIKFSKMAGTLGKNSMFFLNKNLNDLKQSIENFAKYQEGLPPERKPVKQELSFGNTYGKGTSAPPIGIDLNGIKFKLHGSIDRLDSDGKTAWIIDYKNSDSAKAYRKTGLTDQAYLQALLYCAALENLPEGKGVENIKAGFLPLKSGFQEYTDDYTDEAREYLEQVMALVFSIFEVGWFPLCTANITDSDPCRYCDYTRVCGKFKEFIAQRQWDKAQLIRPELEKVIESFAELNMGDA